MSSRPRPAGPSCRSPPSWLSFIHVNTFWTNEKPKTQGWYWVRQPDGRATIFFYSEGAASSPLPGFIAFARDTLIFPEALRDRGYLWAGPLLPPPPPSPPRPDRQGTTADRG